MKTSISIRDRIFLIIILTLIAFRITTGFFGLQLRSLYIEEAYWGIILLTGAIWLITTQKKPTVIAVLIAAFSVVFLFLFAACFYFSWLFVGAIDTVRPEKFAGTDKVVWLEFHQGSWGGEPYETLGMGSSYFGGLMYREDAYLKVNLIDEIPPWSEADDFEIPDSVDVSDCIFWKKKQLLFDMEKKICYRLTPKAKLPLSKEEDVCKTNFEKKWNAALQIEKGMSSIEPLYAQSNTIYVQVNFKDLKKVIPMSNIEVEKLTSEFCREYVTKLAPTHSFDSVMVFFKSHDDRNLYDLQFESKDKYARFSIRNNEVIPCKPGSDFIKQLVIHDQDLLVIASAGKRNESQEPWIEHLGSEYHHLTGHFNLYEAERASFNGLNCEVYKAWHPKKIETPNGYLKCQVTYFIYQRRLVKAVVKYKCFPTNNQFSYKEVVDKITTRNRKGETAHAYQQFVSTKYQDFYHNNGNNTEISCHADTTKVPWVVESTTSIIEPEFVYLYREN